MELTEFFEKVEAHSDLEGVGVDAQGEKHLIYVRHISSKLTTCLPAGALEAADWEIIEDILLGKREPVALQHMTRVVGYYSRIENWNQSKIGELKDRHNGNYAVAGSEVVST